ncbi:hypothetical protein [Bacillus coahuilensis]|uniref:hypothetical protein n=1 Tax=Bacillus coahuilensis TaxID=408580 RepID=UPI000AAB125F|nr:hypothetical protein [Bacillus coahuilensis]
MNLLDYRLPFQTRGMELIRIYLDRLAIAKSIVDLHEGKLSIETDGDLFKVVITLLK